MAEQKAANTAAQQQVKDDAGDRVAMLSVAKDGTPDQVNPTIVGDKGFATEATKRQFREQAVSAADDAAKRDAVAGVAEELVQDPSIAEAQKELGKVSDAAEKRAEKVVNDLHEG